MARQLATFAIMIMNTMIYFSCSILPRILTSKKEKMNKNRKIKVYVEQVQCTANPCELKLN